MNIRERLNLYKPIRLEPDLNRLSENERKILPLLLQAAEAMEIPYWFQEYGNPEPLLASISDEEVRKYVQINYGPWDRMHGNEPIISGVGERPLGANFYPSDITQEEFDSAAAKNSKMKSPFTIIRRNLDGNLAAIPYHKLFREYVVQASEALNQAAELADNPTLQKFLKLRADALLTDNYRASDFAWMDSQDNSLELLIGPMEIEDRLFGIKTAYTGTILIKDKEASNKLARYKDLLPRFQRSLPVPEQYKEEHPGLASAIQVYDALYFAGLDACSIPVGVAWPDDEEIQLQKGVRSLLLKNVMRAKFDAIFTPIADLLIAKDQRQHVHFDGRFKFVMLHELAHGLGVKYTIKGHQTVGEALGDLDHSIEEGKADLVGLFIAIQLNRLGELTDKDLADIYISSLVSLLYNSDARQSVVRMNFFKKIGAYSRDKHAGAYRIHTEKMPDAVELLTENLLHLQITGNYEKAREFMEEYGKQDDELKLDMERMDSAKIPLGIILKH